MQGFRELDALLQRCFQLTTISVKPKAGKEQMFRVLF